jgi:hypothetical protein
VKVRWTPAQLARAGSVIVVVVAVVLSVQLFLAIDAASGSGSDTLLGFVPNDLVIWAVALTLIWLIRHTAGQPGR